MIQTETIHANLIEVYGEEKASRLSKAIEGLIAKYDKKAQAKPWVDEKDVMLITYGDSIIKQGEKPLHTLKNFLKDYIGKTINSVHLLPFYPYTSDDGFSVQDYSAVNPKLGDWEEIHAIADEYDVMFDAVINHISRHSEWFQKYLDGVPGYQDYFVESDPDLDHSAVVRPRALPLLTKVDHKDGTKHVWTTFSDDQIDLNYESESLFLEVLEILIQYVHHGARYLRLDAIGFLWKRLGTTSIHLEETHRIVQVMRDVLEKVSEGTIIITETNVPHKDNISYFGNGHNEAHMVYQFPLPPLTLQAFLSGNADHLSRWADSLEPTSDHTSFFNFLASHDGIGLRPVEEILSKEEVQKMVDQVKDNGGLVSYKDNGDGTRSPYELNINYLSALNKEEESIQTSTDRFLAAQTILLSVKGVPGIYVHSLLGSLNDEEGVKETGRARSINRERLQATRLKDELDANGSLRSEIFHEYMRRIDIRTSEKAFHPNAAQEVLFLDSRLFAIVRSYEEERITCLINVSSEKVSAEVDGDEKRDLLTGQKYGRQVEAAPYQALWLKS